MSTNNHWYTIDNSGMATLCVDEDDARESAKEYAEIYPKRAPYVVGQIVASQPAMPADADDSARMDFIESHPGWLNVYRPGSKTKQIWSFRPPFTNYEYDVFKTAREAIDAHRRIEER